MGILINKSENIFSIQSKNTSYVFGVDNEGLLRNLYWGSKIENVEDFDMPILNEVSTNDPVYEITREEYPVYGSLRYKEHCLKATFSDRSRELVYKYMGYDINDDELTIKLKDSYYDFNINLHYKVYEQYDLIERYVSIKNNSNDIIEIEKIHSGQFHIPYEGLNFSNVHGHWGAEQQKFVQKVNYGKIVIENRRGISTHNHNPYFILDKDATETTGEVFFGALKLSGNFSGIIEQTQYGETLVQMGINSHDFIMELKPKEEFVTPAIIVGYSDSGFETMTHNLHNFAKDNILRTGLRPVLYNSWEATEFKVSCDEQIKLAEKAKEIGAELFVVDDGWFGERHGIDNGLGDWYVNRDKFPEGLDPLIKKVKEMDMMFGIWVEPEMVNPLSQLYKEHPDWIYHFETRESDTSRGQYVLNVTKKEVKEFIYNMLDNLLSTYDIDYIKWDANRPISQTAVERDIWYKHIEGVYDIVRELKLKHPNVLFEACASGGGRIDYGILGIFDDFWTSDNTDAYDRLFIQDTYSYIYPIKAMRAWVTDCPNFLSRRVIPMKFRYHSAMMGTLGIGCNILKFNENEVKLSQELIEEYKQIRHIIQEGNFYRLENTSKNDYKIYQYNKDDESLLFVFLPQSLIGHRGVNIKLRELKKDSKYLIKINGEELVKSGNYLMNKGSNTKKLFNLSVDQKKQIKEELTLDNPQYFKALKYSRYASTKIPKYLRFYTENKAYLEVPRGYEVPFDSEEEIDYTFKNDVVYPDFKLDLRETQQEAFNHYIKDTSKGIIILPTGKGKSILGCYIASQLKQKTLIVVHKDDLVSGWKADAKLCFGDELETGLIKASKRKIGEQITIATIQTLNRLSEEDLALLTETFGLVIVDEMHHSPSSSFDLIQNFRGKYRVGLTATPERTDGLTPLFNFHFGGVAYEFETKEHDEDILPVVVNIHKLPEVAYEPKVKIHGKEIPLSKAPKNGNFRINYHEIDEAVVKHPKYVRKVVNDVIREYNEDRSIIMFFSKKEHCRFYYEYLKERGIPTEEMQLYYGDAKESKDDMKQKAESKEVLITLATYSIATEGTNVKQWEVAFLVSSINNEKNVEQAVGRIRRTKQGKINPVIVHDYSLPNVSVISRHIHTRTKRYEKLLFKMQGTGARRMLFGGKRT